ncbi:MAG: hypothetical protein QXG32_01485 [Candidatus Bathyarchaeia archaeon]
MRKEELLILAMLLFAMLILSGTIPIGPAAPKPQQTTIAAQTAVMTVTPVTAIVPINSTAVTEIRSTPAPPATLSG